MFRNKKGSKLTISHIHITGCCFLPDLTWLGNRMLYRTYSPKLFLCIEDFEYKVFVPTITSKIHTIRFFLSGNCYNFFCNQSIRDRQGSLKREEDGMKTQRILSGMRPTGRLHLGHYTGALENWVERQNETLADGSRAYETYFLVADYHSLTTSLDTSPLDQNSIEMVTDWLAAGIDPEKSPVFRQSRIKEHTELFLIFSMLITASRLERNPTLKDQIRDLNMDAITYGHLGYPVLQAADILLYKGNTVPVGEDQIPHVEITREIARRFNNQYQHPGTGSVFEEPEPKITRFSRLVGLDGTAKMSKSLGNTILLGDTEEEITAKMRKAVTDTEKLRKNDPGRPEVCAVFSYHKRFTRSQDIDEIEKECRSGALGCVDCKKRCVDSIIRELAPLHEKRAFYADKPGLVRQILEDGEQRARERAQATMREVREAMRLG